MGHTDGKFEKQRTKNTCFMASWMELAPSAVIVEFRSLFAHHDKLTLVGFDDDNEVAHMRARDGTFVIFDMLKAEARGALLDDDAAVKFFARIIKGLTHCDNTMQVEFSQPFCNLKRRDETLFDEVMKLLGNMYKDSDTPLWNKIMDALGVKGESCYLVRGEDDGK